MCNEKKFLVRFLMVSLVVAFSFLIESSLMAQWQFNQDFKVSDNYVGIGNSHFPKVAMSNSGNSVTIWTEGLSQEERLYFQLMDKNNKPIGSSVRIVYSVISGEYTFGVGMNSIGDFSVVFANEETSANAHIQAFCGQSSGTPIFLQR